MTLGARVWSIVRGVRACAFVAWVCIASWVTTQSLAKPIASSDTAAIEGPIAYSFEAMGSKAGLTIGECE